MENLKIRVNSEAESKEAQELFFKLGFQWRGLKSPFDLFYPTSMDNYYILLTKGSKEMQIAGAFRDGLRAWKEITLPELRAMANQDQDEPFLTPECTLNDQYAEIEQVRQDINKRRGSVGAASGGAAQAVGGVDATLTERQSQYGCYEDVAHVTQQILSVLRIGNYDELPAPMKESLHMIASKMARIVNGDPEYLDNWHDIGGYAKLIEKLIKGKLNHEHYLR